MSAEKWTPGPWTIRENERGRPSIVTDEAEPWVISTVHSGILGKPERANARLIAAAPALFAALEECARELYEQAGVEQLTETSGTRLLYERARAALSKARGE